MKIVAIIQARMGSTRLPGKVMMKINGQPMLWHVINRLSCSKLINKIVVATTKSSGDKIIADFCSKNGIDCFRGSQENVLDRYYKAALKYKAETIVRITADCPLIDPDITDKVIRGYLNHSYFAGASNVVKRTYPRGLDTEVFAFKVFKQAWEKAKSRDHREHVTKYIYEHPDKYKIFSIEDKQDNSSLRWTVDENRDLLFLRKVYARLQSGNNIFKTPQVIRLLERDPLLFDINRNVKQKASIN